ncbi:hypothetical protein RZS08_12275, partial [Arthrospira platensis SPKY1]|nr:hypothetical protein [Arthrospira platensis SPKY1]
GANSVIDIEIGESLTFNGNLRANQRVSLASTSGNLTVNGTIAGVGGNTLREASLRASGNLTVGTTITASDLIDFEAGGTLGTTGGATLNLSVSGSDSAIRVVSGSNLTINTNLQARRSVEVASTGGSLNITGTISGVGGQTLREVDLAAATSLSLSSNIAATDRIRLAAGTTLTAPSLELAVSGANGVIDLSAGQNLDIASNMRANERIRIA